jgi:hypothetical protein
VYRLLLSKLADSGYLTQKQEKPAIIGIQPANKEPDYGDDDDDDEEEDPYRWFILLGGFLAQAISMCTLSSW